MAFAPLSFLIRGPRGHEPASKTIYVDSDFKDTCSRTIQDNV